jgi:hypothetical protein
MGIWATIKNLLAMPAGPAAPADDPNGVWFHFSCDRCGSVVRVRADRRNDFNRAESGSGPSDLLLRKEVMDNKCFQLMHAEIWTDGSYQAVHADVTGGKLITAEEYEAAMQPPIPS